MRILIINTTIFRCNGIAKVILSYYREMDKRNIFFDFVFINEPENSIMQELKSNGSDVHILSERNKSTRLYMKKLKEIMNNKKYDIVHVHGNSATMAVELIVAKKCGIKVRIAHSHNTTSGHMIIHKLLKPVFNHYYTHGFACGKEAGEWLFGKKTFEIITNGIDEKEFRYNEKERKIYRKKLGLSDMIALGHVGLFSYQKNHEFLIEVFKYIVNEYNADYRLVLIGDGELREETQNLVNDYGLSDKVIFVGQVDNVSSYMQALDLFVLPSRYEGLPLVLVEAQANGLKCVVSNAVTDEANITGNVIYVDLEDGPEIFADKIMEVNIEDRAGRAIKANKNITEKGYDMKENAIHVKKLYKKYIKETK